MEKLHWNWKSPRGSDGPGARVIFGAAERSLPMGRNGEDAYAASASKRPRDSEVDQPRAVKCKPCRNGDGGYVLRIG
jgi:hypothetical protein